eukprot:UN05040
MSFSTFGGSGWSAGPGINSSSSVKADEASVEERKAALDGKKAPAGDENDKTLYEAEVRLYTLKGKWTFTASGTMKVKVSRKDGVTTAARLILRTEKTFQLKLNTMIDEHIMLQKKDQKYLSVSGRCFIDNKEEIQTYLLKFDTVEDVDKVQKAVKDAQEELKKSKNVENDASSKKTTEIGETKSS